MSSLNLTRMSHKFSTALRNTLLRLKATAGQAGTDADFVGFASLLADAPNVIIALTNDLGFGKSPYYPGRKI